MMPCLALLSTPTHKAAHPSQAHGTRDATMFGRGGRGRGGGRFGGRGGMMGGGGATALDHLRETVEEMGLDPRAAMGGGQQQEPLPAYPFVPLYPPRPLTEAEGAKIQAQRELGAFGFGVVGCVGRWLNVLKGGGGVIDVCGRQVRVTYS